MVCYSEVEQKVRQDIRELKIKMADTEEKLNGYLSELGFDEI